MGGFAVWDWWKKSEMPRTCINDWIEMCGIVSPMWRVEEVKPPQCITHQKQREAVKCHRLFLFRSQTLNANSKTNVKTQDLEFIEGKIKKVQYKMTLGQAYRPSEDKMNKKRALEGK